MPTVPPIFYKLEDKENDLPRNSKSNRNDDITHLLSAYCALVFDICDLYMVLKPS
jgi:hypothetical protein